MTVTAEALLARVNADSSAAAAAQAAVDKGAALVLRYLAANLPTSDDLTAWPTAWPDTWDPALYPVPGVVLEEALLICAEDLFMRARAQGGFLQTQYDAGNDGTTAPLLISRDPLAGVRPLLREWSTWPLIAMS